jgi:hypothetical protein
MTRLGRIITVTLGLSIAGAIFGALAGVIGLVVLTVLTGGGLPMLDMAVVPAILGATFGAVGAPAIAWLLLRYVPLGKAVAWGTVGTAAGGVGGWLLATVVDRASPGLATAVESQVKGAILGAIAGFLTAALILRIRAARGKASSKEGRPVA